MMRWGLASVLGLAAVVFHLKYQVMALAQQHQDVKSRIQKTDEALHVLKAEWSHLNNPSRLQTLVNKYLPRLAPIKKVELMKSLSFGDAPRKLSETSKPLTAQQELDALLGGVG